MPDDDGEQEASDDADPVCGQMRPEVGDEGHVLLCGHAGGKRADEDNPPSRSGEETHQSG